MQLELLEMKTVMSEMENTLNGINRRHDTEGEKMIKI